MPHRVLLPSLLGDFDFTISLSGAVTNDNYSFSGITTDIFCHSDNNFINRKSYLGTIISRKPFTAQTSNIMIIKIIQRTPDYSFSIFVHI